VKKDSGAEPVRKSARISAVIARERPKLERNASSLTSLSHGSASGSGYETDESTSRRRTSRRKTTLPPGERIRLAVTSVKYEGSVDYSAKALLPTREGASGRLMFEEPYAGVFIPNLTPEEVLRGGAFGGNYYA
jgi:hypothetical protein